MTDGKNLDGRLREVAVQIALRTGLLKKCPVHGEVYDPGQHDFQGATMRASFLINQSDPLVAPFGGDRAPLLALLKSICESQPSACTGCSRPPAEPAEARPSEQSASQPASRQPGGGPTG